MSRWASALLEAAGPLSLLAGQIMIMSRPFLARPQTSVHIEALSRLLNDEKQAQAFVAFLREVSA